MPYLPARQVEHGIERDYATLQLAADFIESCEQQLHNSIAAQNENILFLPDALRKQLVKIDLQEERLIDLAADGTLPRNKIKGRLNKLALDRGRHSSWRAQDRR